MGVRVGAGECVDGGGERKVDLSIYCCNQDCPLTIIVHINLD